MEQAELVVVGAGPAGLHAAVTAAEAGLSVTVIDSYPRPGGQYFKQIPHPFQVDDRLSHQAAANSLFARFERSGAHLLSDVLVWGIFPAPNGAGWQLALHGPLSPPRLDAQILILAAGAYDRPIPFPGWTLPGVMTAGAALTLIKSQRILPGHRVLLSGTGPLQLAVAAALVHAGAEVVGVLEGSSLGPDVLRQGSAVWGQWMRLREGWDYWRVLRAARVRYRIGWSVVVAQGDGQVQEAIIAQLDRAWRPLPGTLQTVAADTIITGYGFIPSTELSRLIGCAHDFVPAQGGYVPRRDVEMQTTLPGVYAVGDSGGIGGAALASIEGQVAGLAASRRLGRLADQAASTLIAQLQPQLAREQRFARLLGRLFTPGPGLYALADDDTVICRCEEVTVGEIRAAVADGVRSVNELKALTRIGMGNCQGRICGELAARWIAREAGWDDDDPSCLEMAGQFTARPPIHPLPLSVLAGATGSGS